MRFCSEICLHDDDCVEEGEVCALSNNLLLDRVDTYCQPPVGPALPGEECMVADDCAHGVCARLVGTGIEDPGFCSQICTGAPDCPVDKPACGKSEIFTPSMEDTQIIEICTGVKDQ